MIYFPDTFPKNHPPDREYFFNVLNTLNPEYVTKIITHANLSRNKIGTEDQQSDSIEISDAWLEQLKSIPFVSCKS